MNKLKIINDPVHGFITIPDGILLDIINHSYFQRLRRIQQMGLASLIYPGAVHTRFHHAIGAMHLMSQAIDVLKNKGIEISKEEQEAAMAAILLHDIGHGPFSHSLEQTIVTDVHHEDLSLLLMKKLNIFFDKKLDLAIKIFTNTYERRFFHQLVSGQLDTDRLDYLIRDSFYSGVAEGIIGYDRILKMLNIKDDKLVVEEKGIYSIEKFLVSRRLMYWQVYLHKTSVAADHMLINILKRAKYLWKNNLLDLDFFPALKFFFGNKVQISDFEKNDICIQNFTDLDDTDIWAAIKQWQKNNDAILSDICTRLINRDLFKLYFESEEVVEQKYAKICKTLGDKAEYYLCKGYVKNHAYNQEKDNILILTKDEKMLPISEIGDVLTINALSEQVVKHYICIG